MAAVCMLAGKSSRDGSHRRLGLGTNVIRSLDTNSLLARARSVSFPLDARHLLPLVGRARVGIDAGIVGAGDGAVLIDPVIVVASTVRAACANRTGCYRC